MVIHQLDWEGWSPTTTGSPIFPPLYFGEPRFAILGPCAMLGVMVDILDPPVLLRAKSALSLPDKAFAFLGSSLNAAL
jgi:hypothetical protein